MRVAGGGQEVSTRGVLGPKMTPSSFEINDQVPGRQALHQRLGSCPGAPPEGGARSWTCHSLTAEAPRGSVARLRLGARASRLAEDESAQWAWQCPCTPTTAGHSCHRTRNARRRQRRLGEHWNDKGIQSFGQSIACVNVFINISGLWPCETDSPGLINPRCPWTLNWCPSLRRSTSGSSIPRRKTLAAHNRRRELGKLHVSRDINQPPQTRRYRMLTLTDNGY